MRNKGLKTVIFTIVLIFPFILIARPLYAQYWWCTECISVQYPCDSCTCPIECYDQNSPLGGCDDGHIRNQYSRCEIIDGEPIGENTATTGTGCGCGCFEGDTPISTPDGVSVISDLKEGEMVSSYNPETGSESTSIIQKTFEFTRNVYYKIRTKEGKELKVTAEHPLYAIQSTSGSDEVQEEKQLSFWEYLKTESLTKKLLDNVFK